MRTIDYISKFNDMKGKNVWLHKYRAIQNNYNDLDQFPWQDADPVLATVVEVYPRFILFEIQPHINPNACNHNLTVPYRQTVSKIDILTERVSMKEVLI